MTKINAADIKSVLKKMKDTGTPVPYAFGLADKPEECGFTVHKTKRETALRTEMQADTSFKKVGCGTILVKGNELHITETKPISGLDRKLRKLLKDNGLKYIPVAAGAPAAEGAGGGGDAKSAEEARKVLAEIEDLAKKVDALLAEVG